MLPGSGWSRLQVVVSRLNGSAFSTDEVGVLTHLNSLGCVPVFAIPTAGSTDPGALLFSCVHPLTNSREAERGGWQKFPELGNFA